MATTAPPPSVTEVEKPPLDIKTLSEDEKRELVEADALSVLSGTTISAADISFTPVKTLHIATRGIPVLRLPLPIKELEIAVLDDNGALAYTSTRAKKSTNNCVLTDAQGTPLIATEYFFGPGRHPVMKRVDVGDGVVHEITTTNKWTKRDVEFVQPDGLAFTWAYKKQKGFGAQGEKGTALVLTLGERRVAALIRNKETRSEGSKSCSAGNGGLLVLGEGLGQKGSISEDMVVATCLMMLKKEIGRRKMVQVMMIAAASGGG